MELCKKHLNVVLSFNFNGTEIAGFPCTACKLEEKISELDKELEALNQQIVKIIEMPSPTPDLEREIRNQKLSNSELRKILDQQSDEILELREKVKPNDENSTPESNPDFSEGLLKMCERIGQRLSNDMILEMRKYNEEIQRDKIPGEFGSRNDNEDVRNEIKTGKQMLNSKSGPTQVESRYYPPVYVSRKEMAEIVDGGPVTLQITKGTQTVFFILKPEDQK